MAMACGSSNGFVSHTKRQRAQMSTSMYYKSESSATVDTLPQDFVAANFLANPLLPSHLETSPKDLPWFKVERGHQLEDYLEKLGDAMIKSFYTENEVLKLYFAIEEASLGDRNIMTGAAELCLILAETMDMELNTLIAAAFHYSWCISAHKESSSMKPWDAASLKARNLEEHKGAEMFGDRVVEIMRDSARLKKLEMTFSSIVKNPSSKARASLGSEDGNNLRNLLLADSRDWRALAVRSAASLYRLRSIEKEGFSKLSSEAIQSSREALFIFAPLASRLGLQRLKAELEDTAFRILYRRQYAAVTSSLPRHTGHRGVFGKDFFRIGKSMERVLQTTKQDMEEILRDDYMLSLATESFSVTTRVKEPYPMWKKMLRQGANNILEVPDALALRIVIKGKKMSPGEPDEITHARERIFCHYIQHLCMQALPPLQDDPRLKDFIENPKPNGYQSLHYTGSTKWQKEDWTLEVQVRSEEMHKVAEYGLASHWEYKLLNGKTKQSSRSKSIKHKPENYSSNAYLKYLQEWHWDQTLGTMQWEASSSSDNHAFLKDDIERKLRNDFHRDRMKRLEPYLESLKEARLDLAQNNVFVFLSSTEESRGMENIIVLPSNARVSDALRKSQNRTGKNFVGTPYLNGSKVDLGQRLKNGDILTLSTEHKVLGALRM